MLKDFLSKLIVDKDYNRSCENRSILTIKTENREVSKRFIVKRNYEEIKKSQNPFYRYFENIDSLYNCKEKNDSIRYNRRLLSQSRCYNR